ncbi:hypothetical protein B0J13DRAFT_530476 [Dactylonectria estremocensis]|uniref:Uncharacterized protein n=1 Tax=Dactylonectria estremocensis TaxID=1079267 RepID=A0A9P9DZA2_9HYPO|nr:hypothetical protein B0J13DRAFT_530476 [Dactylonectria estremocensis]
MDQWDLSRRVTSMIGWAAVLTKRSAVVYMKNDDLDSIRLSGASTYTNTSSWPCFTEDPNMRHDDLDPEKDATVELPCLNIHSLECIITDRPPWSYEGPYFGFASHSACWNLLTALFQLNASDVFYQCHSMRFSGSILDWGHEYGGSVFWSTALGPPLTCGTASCQTFLWKALELTLTMFLLSKTSSVPILISKAVEMASFFAFSSKDVVHLRLSSAVFGCLRQPALF